jgi:hypothetical protein
MKSFTFSNSAMPKVFQREYEMQVAILPQVPLLSFEISEKLNSYVSYCCKQNKMCYTIISHLSLFLVLNLAEIMNVS